MCSSSFQELKTLDGEWFWEKSALPHLDYYNYLGVKFTHNGHWNAHIKDLVTVVSIRLIVF